jgi:co-chaperonin GroES (HSP10)
MIRPLFDQILVKPAEKKEVLQAETGSFLMYGEVMAIGSECKVVKVGDTICYTLWGLNHIEIDGKKYYFVPEQSEFLLGVLEKE